MDSYKIDVISITIYHLNKFLKNIIKNCVTNIALENRMKKKKAKVKELRLIAKYHLNCLEKYIPTLFFFFFFDNEVHTYLNQGHTYPLYIFWILLLEPRYY